MPFADIAVTCGATGDSVDGPQLLCHRVVLGSRCAALRALLRPEGTCGHRAQFHRPYLSVLPPGEGGAEDCGVQLKVSEASAVPVLHFAGVRPLVLRALLTYLYGDVLRISAHRLAV